MRIKKVFYIALFVLLGVLLNLVMHVALEYPFLMLLVNNPAYYEATWIWQNWTLVHRVVNVALWIIGVGGGYWVGQYYWRLVYESKEAS